MRRLCDVLDAPAPSTEHPSGEQTAALVHLLIPRRQDFWFHIVERDDEVEWSSSRASWACRAGFYIRITPRKSSSWNMDGHPVGNTWDAARCAVHEPTTDEADR